MRTQKLLVAAAALVVSAATSMAQVYSQNIVGYINLTLKPGYNLVANQLDNGAGSNDLNHVFSSLPALSQVLRFNPGTSSYDAAITDGSVWYDFLGNPVFTTVNPGDGFFVYNADPTDKTVTLVGSVRTGTNTVSLTPGYSAVSSVTPESYDLTGTNFPTQLLMQYLTFNPTSQTYDTIRYSDGASWFDELGNPLTAKPAVGTGFFIYNPGSTTNWVRSFNP